MAQASSEIVVRLGAGSDDMEIVRVLMREYGEYLATNPAGAANICLTGYEDELAGLPAPYIAPGALLLAMVGGEAAGCVALKPLQARDATVDGGGKALELKRLWVRAAFRGLGVGRKLMQAAIDYARAAGTEAIYLDTVPAAMPEANRLYAAFGFEEIERYNDNPVADVVFYRVELRVTS